MRTPDARAPDAARPVSRHAARLARPLAAIAAGLILALAGGTRAEAQIPGLPGLPGLGGPQVVIDPAAIAKLVTQINQQVQQIAVARQQLQWQLANMQKLANPNWRAINTTLAQIDALTRQGQAISYSLASLNALLQQTFPGWRVSPTMAADIRLQNERTLATIRATLLAAQTTSQQFALGTAKLAAMKGQVRSITSAQQAAELNGSIAIHAAEELILLRQQLATQANAQAVFLANQTNRDLQGAAVADAFRQAGATTPIRPKNMSVTAVGIP
jgi:P-type conjugative transfer protein TrbJ